MCTTKDKQTEKTEENKMLKLKKLYSLINRNATMKLVNEKHTDVYFCGTVKDIPDQYDLWKVVDLLN